MERPVQSIDRTLGFAGSAAALFAVLPLSAAGALLLVAGTDLAIAAGGGVELMRAAVRRFGALGQHR